MELFYELLLAKVGQSLCILEGIYGSNQLNFAFVLIPWMSLVAEDFQYLVISQGMNICLYLIYVDLNNVIQFCVDFSFCCIIKQLVDSLEQNIGC